MRKTIKQQKQMRGIADEVKVAIYDHWTCGLSVRTIAKCTGFDVAVIEEVLREHVVYQEMDEVVAACKAIRAEMEAGIDDGEEDDE